MFSPELRAKAEQLVDRYPVKRSALLPLLHLVQYQDGYVSDDGIAECAELLDLTKAEVAAVSTFYTMYKREPMGEHLVSVCTNFSCAVRGGKDVYDRLSDHLGVGHDQTTEDGKITLEHAECLGNCEGAPLVAVDYLHFERLDEDAAVQLVEDLKAGVDRQPTRGMFPPGVRASSHRLAGIGPIDESGPGQRLGLATKEHGAVAQPDAGAASPGVGIIDLGGALGGTTTAAAAGTPDDATTTPDEVPPPEQDAGEITTPPSTPEPDAEAVDADTDSPSADEVADEAAPSGLDPAAEPAETPADDTPADEPPAADEEGTS